MDLVKFGEGLLHLEVPVELEAQPREEVLELFEREAFQVLGFGRVQHISVTVREQIGDDLSIGKHFYKLVGLEVAGVLPVAKAGVEFENDAEMQPDLFCGLRGSLSLSFANLNGGLASVAGRFILLLGDDGHVDFNL